MHLYQEIQVILINAWPISAGNHVTMISASLISAYLHQEIHVILINDGLSVHIPIRRFMSY